MTTDMQSSSAGPPSSGSSGLTSHAQPWWARAARDAGATALMWYALPDLLGVIKDNQQPTWVRGVALGILALASLGMDTGLSLIRTAGEVVVRRGGK